MLEEVQLQLGYKDILFFLAAVIFKGRAFKMAATIMTVESGTCYLYSNLEKNFEACSCIYLNRQKIFEHFATYDILI